MATNQNPFSNLSIQGKHDLFVQLFSLGTNTNQSIDEKFELLYLICYLSSVMKKRDPERFRKPINVLQQLYGRDFSDQTGEDSYLTNLAIICEELLFGVGDIKKPEGFNSGSEICARIKDLVNQWMPF